MDQGNGFEVGQVGRQLLLRKFILQIAMEWRYQLTCEGLTHLGQLNISMGNLVFLQYLTVQSLFESLEVGF